MSPQLARKQNDELPIIPDRLYFRIGDVARLCAVETYVLRFWETQFPQLKPNKSGTGQRLYRRRDVEMALEIKRLVHGEGYTISGARQLLEQASRRREPQFRLPLAESASAPQNEIEQSRQMDAVAALIGHARAELREIASLLSEPDPRPLRRRSRLAAVPPPAQLLFPS
jgi:DNA-binding transcriptional MerR regulator